MFKPNSIESLTVVYINCHQSWIHKNIEIHLVRSIKLDFLAITEFSCFKIQHFNCFNRHRYYIHYALRQLN